MEICSNRVTYSPVCSFVYPSNFVFVQIIICTALKSPGKCRFLNMFFLLFLPPAHHHPTGVFVSQGAGRAAYNSGSDVSGKWNTHL